jgi:hypothetical protein
VITFFHYFFFFLDFLILFCKNFGRVFCLAVSLLLPLDFPYIVILLLLFHFYHTVFVKATTIFTIMAKVLSFVGNYPTPGITHEHLLAPQTVATD